MAGTKTVGTLYCQRKFLVDAEQDVWTRHRRSSRVASLHHHLNRRIHQPGIATLNETISAASCTTGWIARERIFYRVLRKVQETSFKVVNQEFVLPDVGCGKQEALNDIKMMKLIGMDIGEKSGPVGGFAWIFWV
jgi:hypothetical protein